jgi:DNA polymerase-3 subunit gamma/tau
VLGDVPPELQVTPERDIRLAEQASALSATDAVRLLDLVSAALEATANGAQARIQLELVLVKAAAPEVDPSMAALLARIERLEQGGGGLRATQRPAPKPAAAREEPVAAREEPAAAREPRAPAVPEPEPEAPKPSEQPSSSAPRPIGLDDATACWPAVVDLVRAENAMLAALLSDARPIAVRDQELTLAFPGGAAFLKKKAEQDDYRRVAGEALQAVTGQRLVLRYELRDAEDEQSSADQVLSGEELVRRFMEEFDAEEVFEDEPTPNEGEVKG